MTTVVKDHDQNRKLKFYLQFFSFNGSRSKLVGGAFKSFMIRQPNLARQRAEFVITVKNESTPH